MKGTNMKHTELPAAYRPNQVANGILPFGRTTIYKFMKEGKLRSVKIGRMRFITSDAIIDFLNGEGE